VHADKHTPLSSVTHDHFALVHSLTGRDVTKIKGLTVIGIPGIHQVQTGIFPKHTFA